MLGIMQAAPSSVQVTSEEIKAVAVAVGGINEAARRLGLKEGTVRQRCKREGWMADAEFRAAIMTGKKSGKAPSQRNLPATLPATVSPAQAIMAEMRGLGVNSRINMARGLAGVAEHVAGRDAALNLADASNVKQSVQSLDIVHGWRDQPPAAKINLHIISATPILDLDPEPIETKWSDVTACNDF
jgi:hypothetical protein